MKTVFESIRAQKQAGLWGDNLAIFARATNLERDYQIYKAITEQYPERKRGYIQKACNSLKISKIGGGIGTWTKILSRKLLCKWKLLSLISVLWILPTACTNTRSDTTNQGMSTGVFVCYDYPFLQSSFDDGTTKSYFRGYIEKDCQTDSTPCQLIIEECNGKLNAVMLYYDK